MDTEISELGDTKDIDLPKLQKLIIEFTKRRNWSQFHNPKDLAVSISIESAELLEVFQWKNVTDLSEADHDSVKSEIADITQYLLLLCNSLNIDIIEATLEKLHLNEKRFPVETSRGVAKPLKDN